MDIVLEVLKWVVIVLLAGFIGQFGKTMSLQLIDYFKKRRENPVTTLSQETDKEKEPAANAPDAHEVKGEDVHSDQMEKAQKKALKAELKMKKKLNKSKAKEP